MKKLILLSIILIVGCEDALDGTFCCIYERRTGEFADVGSWNAASCDNSWNSWKENQVEYKYNAIAGTPTETCESYNETRKSCGSSCCLYTEKSNARLVDGECTDPFHN